MQPPRTPKYITVTALIKLYEKSSVKSNPLYEKQKVNTKQDVWILLNTKQMIFLTSL